MPEGEFVTGEPLDAILWMHILLMGLAFGILFPTGMVCGLTRSRWHVPVQTLSGSVALVGYFLGHAHKGRQFPAGNIHARFSSWVMLTALCQVVLGVILKLHIEKGFLGRVRRVLVKVHLIIAIAFPPMSWVQMLFGAITIPGFCHDDHLGQCLAHEIMGSSFIAYGFFLTTMLFVGEGFLYRTNKSQEFYDSLMITLWGIVNTFTEHRWGQDWNHKDLQHTSMGIIWWAAGLVGLYLSKDWSTGRPRRNHVPALVMIFTGYAMSQHSQNLMVSTMVHTVFGYTLMGAGLVRVIEISFVLRDAPHRGGGPQIRAWQYLTPFLLIESGILFMGATEEQMELLNAAGIMHGSYVLVMSAVAFLLFLLILYLVNLYVMLRSGDSAAHTTTVGDYYELPPSSPSQMVETPRSRPNPPAPAGPQPIRDVHSQDIELEPFLSDDDDLH
ncbi:hypothetical protein TRVA0_080S00122 [Trichomonascus vanleenenianus]|uniref:Ytp1p n=1 Tax=Trichomonascus vanleenenianus TaxID=2268995 RepID=UPI003ECA8D0E